VGVEYVGWVSVWSMMSWTQESERVCAEYLDEKRSGWVDWVWGEVAWRGCLAGESVQVGVGVRS
jgi:hypothetical protein